MTEASLDGLSTTVAVEFALYAAGGLCGVFAEILRCGAPLCYTADGPETLSALADDFLIIGRGFARRGEIAAQLHAPARNFTHQDRMILEGLSSC